MLTGYFITGSDTDVGKTWIACQLIPQLKQIRPSVKVRKPVESGCQLNADNELHPADGFALFQANSQDESLNIITAYRFQAALAPDRAARLEHKNITIKQLQQAVMNQVDAGDTLLVEGAGGFYSPLASDGLNSDLARVLNLEAIIVIEDRLGAINQALMTINAVEKEGLIIHAIILNQKKQPSAGELEMDNLSDLQCRTDHPVYQCLYNSTLSELVF